MHGNIEPPEGARWRIPIWRIVGWGGAFALILVLLVAIDLHPELIRNKTDIIFAIVIFGIGGALVELAVLLTTSSFSRAGSVVAILASSIVFGANLEVGMIGEERNPVNMLFGIVLMAAVIGAWLSGLHSLVLPTFMAAAGTIQAAIGLFAGILGGDPRGGIFTILVALLWWLAGGLFLVALKRSHQIS